MRIVRLPGVFPPHSDTWLLAAVLRRQPQLRGGAVLDVCTGSGDVAITPYRDGPLLVRGAFRILDQDGNEIEAGRETVALCRCGKSRLRPFCDGTHKLVRFKAPSGAEAGRGA